MIAKLLELIGTLCIFMIVYAIIDILYTQVSQKTVQTYAFRIKKALYQMIFLSFAIRYAIENF